MRFPVGLQAQSPFPWRRPRAELVILLLVAAVALSPVYVTDVQDISRLCLTRSLVAGQLHNDRCLARTIDRSQHAGHLYSDKAPGMSVLYIAPAEAVQLPSPVHWAPEGDLRLWLVRVFASGLPFLLCVFLVGRISEGVAPGLGAPAMAVFALGTLMAPLAVAGFDHVPAAGFGFLAFVLAWRRKPFPAGLAAGAALTTEYEAAAILLVVLAYTALQGRSAALRFAAGAAPGAALLAAYDWLAFGAPWRLPYHYLANEYATSQNAGFLGIHVPQLHAVRLVFLGDRGLLVTSPVVLAAAAGLALLWRRGFRAEAVTCTIVTAIFVLAECGYFLPYGGVSPGTRFLTPALPFLALGLAPAFARLPALTTLLAVASVIATTAVTLTWRVGAAYRDTVWGELGRVFTERGSSRLANEVTKTVLVWGPNRLIGAGVTALLAAAVLGIAAPRTRGGR